MTDVRPASHPSDLPTLSPDELRRRYLITDLFVEGEARYCFSQQDRVLIGGIVTVGEAVDVVPPPELRAAAICDRRELGIACLEGAGLVVVDGVEYPLQAEDILYVGQGTKTLTVAGAATYYLVCVPAHRAYPTTLIKREDAETVEIGEVANASRRTLRKYVHDQGAESCELAMGITTLASGSVWNTMPCHTHDRRTEVYLYFGLPSAERIIHLCGQPDATRSIVIADREAVISPPWSVHFGAGTAPYKFIWATGGENLAYNDMDPVATTALA